MKKSIKYFCIVLFCINAVILTAQPGSKKDKIDELRVNFINNKVNLTPQEAQVFWPIYKEYNDKHDNLKKTFRQQHIKDVDFNAITDKEAESYLLAELTLKQKEYELSKEYYERFKKILPIKKLALVKRAEEEFRKELIKNIKNKSAE